MRPPLLARQAVAEFLGSAGLVSVVISSGVAAGADEAVVPHEASA